MVNAPTSVAFYSVASSVVPEGVLAFVLIVFSECVCETPIPDFVEGLRDFRAEADVAHEAFGIMDVNGFWGDVQIAEPDDLVRRREMRVEIGVEPFEPGEFVFEFV